MRKRIILFLSGLMLLLAGCGKRMPEATKSVFAMDTYITMTAYGGDAKAGLNACAYELARWEKLFSATLPASDVSRVNAANGQIVLVGHDTAEMLETALAASRLTHGAFDVTVYPLVDAWGFLSEAPHVPQAQKLSEALSLVGWEKLSLNGVDVQLPAGMGIDLGGVAKGYTSDRFAAILSEHGVEHAIFSLGGNVMTLGSRPDGTPWRVAVMNPFDQSASLGTLKVKDRAVITSGAYQRGFTEGGVYYHHILDPRTGYPSCSDLVSVTVVSENGTLADALSTGLFVLGEEKARALWEKERSFDMILLTKDGRIIVSGALDFTQTDAETYPLERIS